MFTALWSLETMAVDGSTRCAGKGKASTQTKGCANKTLLTEQASSSVYPVPKTVLPYKEANTPPLSVADIPPMAGFQGIRC